jgi:hypothetical protein
MKIIIIAIIIVIVVVILVLPKKNKTPETQMMDPNQISFSQLDITESFDDNQKLGIDDWIETSPLNKMMDNPEASGLPPENADPDVIYEIGAKLSKLREGVPIPNDGVYCPVCHIANIDIKKLHQPCPKCERGLLKFGWE